MDSLEDIRARLLASLPGTHLELIANGSPCNQHSLLVGREDLLKVAEWLRGDDALRMDYCSNVTGVDWPGRSEKVKVTRDVDGVSKEVEETRESPGCLEVVYHLYSVSRKLGPVILRARTLDRGPEAWLPSLTPVWRSCELQEREVYDLFGVRFQGHPDLRRLLMWEGFADHPMRKDYVEPDDYEYEPTPHDRVLERVAARRVSSEEEAR